MYFCFSFAVSKTRKNKNTAFEYGIYVAMLIFEIQFVWKETHFDDPVPFLDTTCAESFS